jgi:hypothetical protein
MRIAGESDEGNWDAACVYSVRANCAGISRSTAEILRRCVVFTNWQDGGDSKDRRRHEDSPDGQFVRRTSHPATAAKPMQGLFARARPAAGGLFQGRPAGRR